MRVSPERMLIPWKRGWLIAFPQAGVAALQQGGSIPETAR